MMLQTIVKTPKYNGLFDHSVRILSLGSCFADNVAEKLKDDMFHVCANPFGVLFNPESIAQSLERITNNVSFTAGDFNLSNGKYFSFSLHSSFSSETLEDSIGNANKSLAEAHSCFEKAKVLIITFGTAYVYRLKGGRVVANCHKEPQSNFVRVALSVSEIVERYKSLLSLLWQKYDFKVLFTVSPIRHLRDGIHENQVSKSILHLAVNELNLWNPERFLYFPSYEIMMDELRDYRFYADDMVHPSDLAVSYIYEKLMESTMSDATIRILPQIRSYTKLAQHRLKDESQREAWEKKLKQMRLEIESQLPGVDLWPMQTKVDE